jgi:hypothetical protein
MFSADRENRESDASCIRDEGNVMTRKIGLHITIPTFCPLRMLQPYNLGS